ncbi:unnamed protein product [Trichobilharzia regenti]|nr:unnamed protein product [Trichobilharzia regenti]
MLLPGHTTVLDDSLGLALWFAARGQGVLHNPNGVEVKCTSSAKMRWRCVIEVLHSRQPGRQLLPCRGGRA